MHMHLNKPTLNLYVEPKKSSQIGNVPHKDAILYFAMLSHFGHVWNDQIVWILAFIFSAYYGFGPLSMSTHKFIEALAVLFTINVSSRNGIVTGIFRCISMNKMHIQGSPQKKKSSGCSLKNINLARAAA